jgi:hypothetical protein
MANDYATGVHLALIAALRAAPEVSDLVADRIVDEPADGIAFPYIRLGRIEPVADDTDGTQGALVSVGLEVHSRPTAGRVEATMICQAISLALHRKPEALAIPGLAVSEIEVQTYVVLRAPDGKSYEGTMALQVSLDA